MRNTTAKSPKNIITFIICNEIFFLDRRRPARTGADRHRPAQTGYFQCLPIIQSWLLGKQDRYPDKVHKTLLGCLVTHQKLNYDLSSKDKEMNLQKEFWEI